MSADLERRIAERKHAVEQFNSGPRREVMDKHQADLRDVTGFRRQVMQWHGPYMEFEYNYNHPYCYECTCSGTGCLEGYRSWPCEMYRLARDWKD